MWLSSLLPQWVKSWMHAMCKEYKHMVVDCAHPLPSRVVLYPGRAGGVHNVIVTETLHFLETTAEIVELDALLAQDEADVPALRYMEGSTARESDCRGIIGCLTVVRFLGRHWHEYPLHPINAARIDSALELLETFLVPLEDFVSDGKTDALTSHVRTFVARLEYEQLCECDDEYFGGFARATIADVCWNATFRWLLRSHPQLRKDVLETNEFPQVSLWWQTLVVKGEEVEIASGDNEGDDEEGDDTATSSDDEENKEEVSVGETTMAKKDE